LSLRATSILTFGDSITEGREVTPLDATSLSGVGCSPFGTAIAYPVVLNDLLRTRYPTQNITAKNCGWGGEEAVEGVTRLPTGLATGVYDVVLLMEGTNDLNAVVSMIRTARAGRTVFVGTLTPQRAGGKGPRPEWVEPVNARLRSVVPAEGAVLVDTWLALGGTADPYISSDGIHPTSAGYRTIADAFMSAFRTTLETKVP
jgi:lysophospholipase L1-like esterase